MKRSKKLTEAEAAERYEAHRRYMHTYDIEHRQERHLRKAWYAMKDMCHNRNSTSYKNYGAFGITVCDEWREDYAVFEAWARTHGYSPEMVLARIDKSKGYSPENCRWVTKTDPARFRRSRTRNMITYNGETRSLSEWARIVGMRRGTLSERLKAYGWSIEKALTTPVRTYSKSYMKAHSESEEK